MPSLQSTQHQLALAGVRSGIPNIGIVVAPCHKPSVDAMDLCIDGDGPGGGGGGAGGKFANTSSFSRVFHCASSDAGVGGALGSIVGLPMLFGIGTTFGGGAFGFGFCRGGMCIAGLSWPLDAPMGA